MPSAQPYVYSENDEKTLTPHILLPFLQSQSQNTLTRLYQRPSSCLSIFRWNFFRGDYAVIFSLTRCHQITSPFGKANYHESPLAWIRNPRINNGGLGDSRGPKVIVHWDGFPKYRKSSSFNRLYDEALATLGRLHILPNSAVKLALNSTFKSGFRQAITGGWVGLFHWVCTLWSPDL